MAAIVALALLASSTPAHAQPSHDDPLVAQAEQLAARGDHAAALALLRVVVERRPSPRALGLLGLSALRQGESVDAEAALQRALATPADAWVAAHRRELNAALTETARQLGTVIVEGVEDGTTVRIAGRDVGPAPLAPIRAPAGTIVIEAGTARVTAIVVAGGTVTVAAGAPPPASGQVVPSPLPASPSDAAPPPLPAVLEGYEAAPSPPQSAGAPASAFGDAPADAEIPASFTSTFPAPREHTSQEPSSWTDGFRLNVGLGIGAIATGLDKGVLRSSELDQYGTETVFFGGRSITSPTLVVLVSGGIVYGLALAAEFTARLDVVVAPTTLDAEGYYTNPSYEYGYGTRVGPLPEVQFGAAWLVAPVLTPGLRVRPLRTGPFYVAIGLRIGFAAAVARMDVWSCDPTAYGCSYTYSSDGSGRPARAPDRRSSASSTSVLYGGELGVGAALGDDAGWDLGFRLTVDNLAVSSFVTLDRRLL